MDINLARHTVRIAFQASRDLEDLMHLLKEQLDAEEYQDYVLEIATAIAGIGEALTNKALARYPQLKDEIDEKLAKYGPYI